MAGSEKNQWESLINAEIPIQKANIFSRAFLSVCRLGCLWTSSRPGQWRLRVHHLFRSCLSYYAFGDRVDIGTRAGEMRQGGHLREELLGLGHHSIRRLRCGGASSYLSTTRSARISRSTYAITRKLRSCSSRMITIPNGKSQGRNALPSKWWYTSSIPETLSYCFRIFQLSNRRVQAKNILFIYRLISRCVARCKRIIQAEGVRMYPSSCRMR